jgi:hypothetical protein
VRPQIIEVDELKRRDVGGFQHDLRRAAVLESLSPSVDTKTPTIARLQSSESVRQVRR